jgi:hypothetical protein
MVRYTLSRIGHTYTVLRNYAAEDNSIGPRIRVDLNKIKLSWNFDPYAAMAKFH